jgi:hypothetical protein
MARCDWTACACPAVQIKLLSAPIFSSSPTRVSRHSKCFCHSGTTFAEGSQRSVGSPVIAPFKGFTSQAEGTAMDARAPPVARR